ncbi:hypothetical protein ACFL2P_00045 [Candidatus Moduliflexota bacterium]
MGGTGKRPVESGSLVEGGFTLVEVAFTLGIMVVVALLMYGIIGSLYKSWVSEGLRSDMRQNVRIALDTVTRDLEMAGFQTSTYGDQHKGNLAITLAAVDEIEFDEQRLNISDGNYEPRMFYYHLATDAATGRKNLYRQFRIQPGLASADEIIAENISAISISYFDEDDTAVTGLPLSYVYGNPPPQDLLDIRKVCVAVTARTDRTPPAGVGPETMNLSACVTPRNLTVEETALDAAPPSAPTGLFVADTGSCTDKLCLRWSKNPEPDVAGYVVFYGAGAKSVPLASLSDPDNPRIYLNSADLLVTKNVNRLTSPNTYTISVAAYDTSANYGAQSATVSGNPPPGSDERDCAGGTVIDTTFNPVPPSVPEGMTVAPGAENEIILSWTPPADGSATAGFRLYRSDTQFADGVPVDPAFLIADESTLGAGATGYTDPGLVGCQTYYYALASINCDESLAMTYAFDKNPGQGDYAKADGDPEDLTPPPPTSIADTTSGWKRIFLSFDNPLPDDVNDFNRTEIYYSEGSNCPSLQPGGSVAGGSLIPDSDGGTPGTFVTPGSHAVVFDDHLQAVPPPPGDPTLNNMGQYCLLSVAYDDCENTAVDTSSLVLIDLCGDDPPGPPPEWPLNPTYSSCSPEWVKLTWEYPPKHYVGPGQVYDFAGYRIWRTGPEPGTEIELTDGPTWNESWIDGRDLQEGGQYRYTVRATDCVYENDGANYPNNYSTALFIPSDSTWVSPGRLTLFRGFPSLPYAAENFVSAHSDESAPFTHHNNVRFFIENTSQSTMTMETIRVVWGNPNVLLESVTVGGPPSTTAVNVRPTGGVPSGTAVAVNITVNDTATGLNQPSGPVPVVLRFTNIDGSVNRFSDMRTEEMIVSLQSRNNSLQQATCDPEDFIVSVPQGPLLGRVLHDWPDPFGSSCYEVVGRSGSARDDDLSFPALIDINVGALARDNSAGLFGGTEQGFDTLSLFATAGTVTDPAQTPAMPTGVTFTELPLQQVAGDQYAIFNETAGTGAKMPVNGGAVTWYYLLAVDRTGNFDRFPDADFGACAYFQKDANSCNARPKPPVLTGTASPASVELSWEAPTEYVDGGIIPLSDALFYDVYVSSGGGGFTLLAADVLSLSHTHSEDITAGSFAYRVVAKNTCAEGALESDPSNLYRECEGESSVNCDSFSVPLIAGLEEPFSISARDICLFALNGVADSVVFRVRAIEETRDFTVNETGDTGTFILSVTPTECDHDDRRTYTTSKISIDDSVIPVASTQCLPPSGIIEIDNEQISYSGISAGALRGALRGAGGTTAAKHNSGRRVYLVSGAGSTIEAEPDETLTVQLITGDGVECSAPVTISSPCDNIPTRPSPFNVVRGSSNEEAVIVWGAPLYNTDGSPVLDLGGYEIEARRCKDPEAYNCDEWSPWETINIPDPSVTSFTVTGLQSRRTGFQMRAYDLCRPVKNYSSYTDVVRH